MDIREKYIKYFEEKNHLYVKSAPLVPKEDKTVLFNTAGMLQFVPYLVGEKSLGTKRVVNYQMCIRTNDLEEVGDKTHHTFFEMLGNWSFGDYFKEESIKYSYDFLTNELNIPHEKLAITVFKGNDSIPVDNVSYQAWKEIGFTDNKIAFLEEDNFWIAGDTGPCGGDTEIFYFRSDEPVPLKYDPEDERWVEIWNNVFMEYYKHEDGSITQLEQKNVDTGMGLERIISVIENKDDNYLTSVWTNIIKEIETISGKSYKGNERYFRIIADHIKASVFILADESKITPSNTNQGYILRRLIRRMIRFARRLEIDLNSNFEEKLAQVVINDFKKYYPHLETAENFVIEELKKEKENFSHTLDRGIKEFKKILNKILKESLKVEITTESEKTELTYLDFIKENKDKYKKELKEVQISAQDSFKLYDTYGFPFELTKELADEYYIDVDEKGFKEKYRIHQEKSRAGGSALFSKTDEDIYEETKNHTAAHLLHSALRKVLGEEATQKGYNVTKDRIRFDFKCDHKLTEEEINSVETLVNKWINENIDVVITDMPKEEAVNSGADGIFLDRYPDIVSVYKIGDVSLEICGGPHVKNTKELGEFKITKEQSSSSGVRRVRAILK